MASTDTVSQIGWREQRRRRDDHRPELHRREHGLPQRLHVAEHQQDAVVALDAETTQPVRKTARSFGELCEGQGCRIIADNVV